MGHPDVPAGCGAPGPGLPVRLAAVTCAVALAGAASAVLGIQAERVAHLAVTQKLMLPAATSWVVGFLVDRQGPGPSVVVPAMVALTALLMAPYFLACMMTARAERCSTAALALRLAIQTTCCGVVVLLGLLALNLPFAPM
jgi:hypothetical protein